MQLYKVYMGCIITRNTRIGALPWESYVDGMFVYADTLAGIKQLIRERIKK